MLIESGVREEFNVPKEVQLNDAYAEEQWKCFRNIYKNTAIMYSDGKLGLVRKDTE